MKHYKHLILFFYLILTLQSTIQSNIFAKNLNSHIKKTSYSNTGQDKNFNSDNFNENNAKPNLKYSNPHINKKTITLPEVLVLDRIEQYIKTLPDCIIEFKQEVSNSNQVIDGVLVLSKKYGLRCNYFDPSPLLIVLTKANIAIYDYKLNSLTKDYVHFDLWNFLLTGEVNKNSEVIEIASANNLDYIVIKHEELFIAKIAFNNKITLNPQTKTQNTIITSIAFIEIIENENDIIRLNFINTNYVKNLNKDLFIIREPNIFGKPKKLNFHDFQKMYK